MSDLTIRMICHHMLGIEALTVSIESLEAQARSRDDHELSDCCAARTAEIIRLVR